MVHLLLIHLLLLFKMGIGLRLWYLLFFLWHGLFFYLWLVVIHFNTSRLLLLFYFFFFFIFLHALDFIFLLFLILLFVFFEFVVFPLDFFVKFLQFLVDFAWHQHTTLRISSFCVLPDLFNLLIIGCLVIFLVESLRHSIMSFPQSRRPYRLMRIFQNSFALVDDDVPFLYLQLTQRYV